MHTYKVLHQEQVQFILHSHLAQLHHAIKTADSFDGISMFYEKQATIKGTRA